MLADILRFAVFAALGVVGPGIGIQRLARVPVDSALVLPLGTAAVAAAYGASLVSDLPWLFPLLLLPLCLVAVWRPRHTTWAAGPSLRGALPAIAAILLLLAATQYGTNRIGPEGRFLLDPLVPFDAVFHVGLTWELSLGYPPQLPGVSGFPLGYHLGPDLFRAAALRLFEIHPFDSISRFDVTLWAVALVLAMRGLTARLFPGSLAVALVPWTLLATDFSFVFFANPQAHWWSDLLRGNLLVSLCLANPVVPGLALTVGCLIAVARHEAGEGRGWLCLAAILALAVPFFKVFLGAHLLLGLGGAALLDRRRAPALAAVGLGPALATALLVLGQGGTTVDVSLAPLDLVHVTRASLELPALSGGPLLAWALMWLLASLGLRVLGLWPALQGLRAGPSATRVTALMALAAWPLGLLFRVAAREVLPGQKFINDAAYLLEQGGPLLWVFTAGFLATLCRTRLRTALILAGCGLLAFPSTAQYAHKKLHAPSDPLPAPMVRAALALQELSEPGDVILQRPRARYPPGPVILVGRRVPYERFTPYSTQFASAQALSQRHETVYRFFRTRENREAREIAESLGARFVCLYQHDRLRFDTSTLLELVYEEPEARCYRVLPSQ